MSDLDLDYEKGLRKLLSLINPNLKIGKDALKLLSNLCNAFNARLIKESKVSFNSTKRSRKKTKDAEITPIHVQKAVKKLLKYRLRDLAISEGQKCVYRYCNQLLKYDENKAPELALKHAQQKLVGSEFSRGLIQLMSMSQRNRVLTVKGKTLVTKLLHTLCSKIIDDAVKTAKGKPILSEDDVAEAIKSKFSSGLLKHAHGHGSKFVFLFSEGLLDLPKMEIHEEKDPKRRRMADLAVTAEKWRKEHDQVFVSGIRQLLRESNDNIRLDQKAVLKLESLLIKLAPSLAIGSIKHAINQHTSELEALQVKAALSEIFPPNLARHAQAEAGKVVTLYNNGFIHFTPVVTKKQPGTQRFYKDSLPTQKLPVSKPGDQRKKKLSAKREKPKDPLSFRTALRNLCKEIHDTCSLNQKSVELLNKVLLELAQRIIRGSLAALTAKGQNELSAQEIQESVSELFSEELKIHALSEGNRYLLLGSANTPQSWPHQMALPDMKQKTQLSTNLLSGERSSSLVKQEPVSTSPQSGAGTTSQMSGAAGSQLLPETTSATNGGETAGARSLETEFFWYGLTEVPHVEESHDEMSE